MNDIRKASPQIIILKNERQLTNSLNNSFFITATKVKHR